MPGQVLLSNMYGAITRSEDGVIVCECRGLVVTVLLLLAAVLMLSGAVTSAILFRSQLAVGGLVPPLLMGLGLGTVAYRRVRMHGGFILDREKGTFARGRGGHIETLSLEHVRGPWLIRDYTDGMGMSPRWLVVEVDGRRFRLGKGSADELKPAIAALAAIGIAGTERR